MSEWNYTKCAKPFSSVDEARQYLEEKDFAGWILKRDNGYSAVCPTYPEGFYPDATKVEVVNNSKNEMGARSNGSESCCA